MRGVYLSLPAVAIDKWNILWYYVRMKYERSVGLLAAGTLLALGGCAASPVSGRGERAAAPASAPATSEAPMGEPSVHVTAKGPKGLDAQYTRFANAAKNVSELISKMDASEVDNDVDKGTESFSVIAQFGTEVDFALTSPDALDSTQATDVDVQVKQKDGTTYELEGRIVDGEIDAFWTKNRDAITVTGGKINGTDDSMNNVPASQVEGNILDELVALSGIAPYDGEVPALNNPAA
jgi:hypothetical protein